VAAGSFGLKLDVHSAGIDDAAIVDLCIGEVETCCSLRNDAHTGECAAGGDNDGDGLGGFWRALRERECKYGLRKCCRVGSERRQRRNKKQGDDPGVRPASERFCISVSQ
jgi:hypothetical protein